MPLHLTNHWTMSCINFEKKRLEYYDSFHGNNSRIFPMLREYLAAESLDKKKVPFDFEGWTHWMPSDIPAQHNGFDCGVFTCQYMEFLSRDEDFCFDQSRMVYYRKRIAWECANVKLLV